MRRAVEIVKVEEESIFKTRLTQEEKSHFKLRTRLWKVLGISQRIDTVVYINYDYSIIFIHWWRFHEEIFFFMKKNMRRIDVKYLAQEYC